MTWRTCRTPTRARALAVVAAVALGVPAGCADDSTGTEDQAPEQVLAGAKTKLDQTPGVTLGLTTPELPEGVQGVLSATGVGTHAPAFEGTIKAVVNGVSVDVPVVAVADTVYAKLPFTKKYVPIDPADYGAPDPSQLMATEGGISSWLTAIEQPTEGDQVRDGEAVLTTYTGTLPGDAVASVIPSADTTADFDTTLLIDPEGRLSSADISGPFYGDQGTVDYTVDISDYGTDKTITEP